MRRFVVFLIFLALLGAIFATGCSGAPPVDPKLGPLLDHEIDLMCSAAKTPGPRSIAQVTSIAAANEAMKKHRAEGWRSP